MGDGREALRSPLSLNHEAGKQIGEKFMRCARNATFFRHFLAHLSDILAHEWRGSDEKGK
jgi:hypothetical protein